MRYKVISENKKGRDFVVGDLHGTYSILKELLDRAGFNSAVDRLFLVGDLLDRGPESEKCLQLLLEPWCFAVAGNHEQIFVDAVAQNVTWLTINDYWGEDYGGGWTRPWFERNAPELKYWASVIQELPLVIHVESENKKPFWLVHAELWSPYYDLNETNVAQLVEHADSEQVRILQWSRMLVKQSTIGRRCTLPGPVYCGHTPINQPGKERFGHINLDAGAGTGRWGQKLGISMPRLYLYCHTNGKFWLQHVPQN